MTINYPDRCKKCKHAEKTSEDWPCCECTLGAGTSNSDMFEDKEAEIDAPDCSLCEYEHTNSAREPCASCTDRRPKFVAKRLPVIQEAPEAEIDVTVEKLRDNVNSPAHYNKFPVEVIQISRHLMSNRGQAVQYICRAGNKAGVSEVEDLKKAIWFLEDEIQRLTGEGTHAKP